MNFTNEITVSGATYDEALQAGLDQLGVEAALVDIEELTHAHEDLLPGAAPLEGVTLRLRLKTEEIVARARRHLEKVLALIGLDAKVEVLHRPRGTILNIHAGEDGSLVIGKGGQNIEALQYLINRMATRGTRDVSPIMIDCEGYKEKHLQRLEDIARKAAQRVLRTRREVALKPMPPADRRIIHLALKGVRGVHTISRGEEGRRHVVVTTDRPMERTRLQWGRSRPHRDDADAQTGVSPGERPPHQERQPYGDQPQQHRPDRPQQGAPARGGRDGGRGRRGGRNRRGRDNRPSGAPRDPQRHQPDHDSQSGNVRPPVPPQEDPDDNIGNRW
jgi:spoIIIJ-associated protein